jgi:5-methyltetrahydropteroyltriglutamate--homocysteine methyltransferase
MDLCVDLINQTLDGIKGIATGMHLCHAHFERKHGTEGPYDLIMPALAKVQVGIISMEYSTPVAGGLASLAQFPENVRLGLGCIDHCNRQVEAPEAVISRVEGAMRYVDKERITLHPDCGFSPSVQNPMDLDEAYLKLKAMCQAAALLRSRYT